eukprot:TRINITY_DN10232_c0_g1_i1.p1 TRINITY_DN10232_c0_g1~~TRINITY_DN10232_c0_g1_i1.p1  ORF type:complete len:135 (-),score=15.82 TRINITY_DN10232_c0_g1_i1:185-589(-)
MLSRTRTDRTGPPYDVLTTRSPSGKALAACVLAADATDDAKQLYSHVSRLTVRLMFSELEVLCASFEAGSPLFLAVSDLLEDRRRRRVRCGNEGCTQTSTVLKMCARCETISYCCKACQAADWPRHKQQCKRPT